MSKRVSATSFPAPLTSRDGATLIMAMLVLALVTVMGVYSATRSSVEQHIAKNMQTNMSVFFVADGGLNHAKAILEKAFADENGSSANPTWTFALDGVSYFSTVPMNYYREGVDIGDSLIDGSWTYGGVQVLQRSMTVGNHNITYTISMWDNDETNKQDADGNDCPDNTSGVNIPTQDCDGTIYLRSVAVATLGGSIVSDAIQEMTLLGSASGLPQNSGNSDQGGGSGNTNSGLDINAPSTIDLSSGFNIGTGGAL